MPGAIYMVVYYLDFLDFPTVPGQVVSPAVGQTEEGNGSGKGLAHATLGSGEASLNMGFLFLCFIARRCWARSPPWARPLGFCLSILAFFGYIPVHTRLGSLETCGGCFSFEYQTCVVLVCVLNIIHPLDIVWRIASVPNNLTGFVCPYRLRGLVASGR